MRQLVKAITSSLIVVAMTGLVLSSAQAQPGSAQAQPGSGPVGKVAGSAGNVSSKATQDAQTTLFDEAGVFNPAQNASIDAILKQILDDHGCPIFVATMPYRVDGMNMNELAARLFHDVHGSMQLAPSIDGMADSSQGYWKVGVMIALDANRNVCGMYAAPGWDRRDAERILRVNNGTTAPPTILQTVADSWKG